MPIFEKNDLQDNVNILIELDKKGNVVSMTIEHAKQLTDISGFSFNQVESVASD